MKTRTLTLHIAALTAAVGLTMSGTNMANAANSGIYGGGPFYINAANNIAEIRNSGFTEVVVWNIFVNANGDLNFNGEFLLCSGGSYVGGSTHSDFAENMSKLKQGTVRRINFGIGSSVVGVFQNIRDLVNSQGTGSGSILYRNFQALKNAIPALDAVDFDDENCFDQSSMVKFSVMLGNLGYKVTLCPYNNSSFWTSVASQVNSQRPGTIDAIHLQCYDGGAGNSPCSGWNFGGIPVYPGVWCNVDSASSTQTKMTGWKNSCGISGGWVWIYDSLIGNAKPYATAINTAIGGIPPTGKHAFFMIVNKNSGKCLDLIGGNTANGARINQWTYDYNGANQRFTILPTENNDHFKLISWVSGKCACIAGDSTSTGAQLHNWEYVGNNTGQQFDFVDAGNGWFKIKNVKSGLVLEVANAATTNDAKVQQWTDNGAASQQWRLQPWGDYFIRADGGRYVCIQGMGSANGSRIIQYDWENNAWFKWRFTNKGDGWYGCYSLNALTKVLCVEGASTVAGRYCHLWEYNASNIGDQKVRIMPQLNGTFKFYFAHDGQTWDIPGGQTGNNIPLEQSYDNGYSWQKFRMERVP